MASLHFSERSYVLAVLSLMAFLTVTALALDLVEPIGRAPFVVLLGIIAVAFEVYRRGREQARLVVVVVAVIGYPLVEQEPFLSVVPNLALLVPGAVALGLASAPWVLFASLAPYGITLARAGGGGVHATPVVALLVATSAVAMTLGRFLMDRALAAERTARARAEEARDRARDAVVALEASRDEQRRLMADFAQRQRLESLGSLAGGIAHDFNNLLTGVSATASLLRAEPETAGVGRELLELSDRGARLSRQLIAFARDQPLQLEAIDLGALVQALSRMLGRILGDGVEMTVIVPETPAVVHADQGQLEQVVTNLAVNARDAMAGEGSLRLEVQSVAEGFSDEVELRVVDDGPGIAPETEGRLFDPFFSTKGSTGLGLATCYGIVTQHGGTIEIRDTGEGGATFVVRLPRSDLPLPEPSPERVDPEREPSGRRVLLVEDDPAVRRATRRLLAREGFEVQVATNGVDALERLEDQACPDLLVTDISMPEMNGEALVAELLGRWPELPVVFVTGHPTRGDPRPRFPDTELVLKPYDAPTLLAAITRARS